MRHLVRQWTGQSLALALYVAFWVGLAPATAAQTANESAGVSFEEVRPGIWAALQPEPLRFNDSNSVVLLSDTDVIVIDSQANPATSRALVERVRSLTDKPVRYLVNSHFHSDHTRSNFVYRELFPKIEIIGHQTLVQDIPARAAPDLERELALYRREIPAGEERLAKGVDRQGGPLAEAGKATLARQIEAARETLAELESIRWVAPSLDVTRSITLHRSLGPIEIRPVHAHTRGDLIVYLPRAKVLVTGDVLDDLPYGGHGYIGDWIAVLSELEALDWDVLVPGHGRIRRGDDARAHLATVRSLFEWMLASARQAIASRRDLESARVAFLASKELARFRATLAGDGGLADRAFDDFVPAGFERAFLEISGGPLD